VENVGHCVEQVVSAIKEQWSSLFIRTCFHVAMYEPCIELVRRLNDITPGDFPKKTFFVNSGAEAVENGVKIARYATKRPAIIAFQNAFHGRTYMAMTLTSQITPYKWGFGPFCPEIYRIPFAYCYRCSFGLEYPTCRITVLIILKSSSSVPLRPTQWLRLLSNQSRGKAGSSFPPWILQEVPIDL
jgi:4-aminobutyrate aminotransferase/(S)-3-amino-2-methylpropionate transaminase